MSFKEYWLPFEVILNPPDQIDYGAFISLGNIIGSEYSVRNVNFEWMMIRLSSVVTEENRTPNPPSWLFWPNLYTSQVISLKINEFIIKKFYISILQDKTLIYYNLPLVAASIEPYSITFQPVSITTTVFVKRDQYNFSNYTYGDADYDLDITYLTTSLKFSVSNSKYKHMFSVKPKTKTYVLKNRFFPEINEFNEPLVTFYNPILVNVDDFISVKFLFYNFSYSSNDALFEGIFVTISILENTNDIKTKANLKIKGVSQ